MIDPASCLSSELGPMGIRVEALVREYRDIWLKAPAGPLPLGKTFAPRHRKPIERDLSALVDRLSAEGKERFERNPGLDPDRLEELAAGLRPVLKRILGLADLPLESVYDERFADSTRRFLKAARDFDPGLGLDAVCQALRNVWIMNTLQFAMGLGVEHTDPIFGYSMVYPYLDNFLDDDEIPPPIKLATLSKLKRWLEGRTAPAEDLRQQKLRSLIGMVEDRFSRTEHPGVFRSMLAIYNAQIKSLLQQRGATSAKTDILGISLEKGGTSVLADGYLVAGELDPAQEDFCFGFGTFLQLADDLQDIGEDARRGHRTLFSQAAGGDDLDPLFFKFLRFMTAAIEKTTNLRRPETESLRTVILRGCSLMALEAVEKHRRFFSRRCLRLCRESFPVRFSFLRKLRRRIRDRFLAGKPKIADIDPVLAAFLALSSRTFSLD